ncbi:MAG: Arc family DNA-binding protein [Candidatus Binatia bacterium]
MATLHVRNIPEDLHKELWERAKAEGRSLSAEVVTLLQRGLRQPARPQSRILAGIAARHRYSPREKGAPTSTELLRQDRGR